MALTLLLVGSEALPSVPGAIRDGFLEEKEFEQRRELSLSLNGCLIVAWVFLFWTLFYAWYSNLDEVVAGLKSLSGVKEVERGSIFVLAFGDQWIWVFSRKLIYLLMIVIQLFGFISFLSILVAWCREFRQFTDLSSGWVRKLPDHVSTSLGLRSSLGEWESLCRRWA